MIQKPIFQSRSEYIERGSMYHLKSILSIIFIPITCFGSYSLDNLTVEEKVGQLLIVHFNGETANGDAETLIKELGVGGIIYYNWSNGLNSPEQVSTLSRELQQLASLKKNPIPLFIAVDQEGGRVSRLKNGFTPIPSNEKIASSGNPDLAKHYAEIIAKELKGVGINFNLAPVVDINSNPDNPVINDRSYGNSAETVSRFAEKALEGYHQTGIITSLKHYPGHGDVSVDSHYELPLLNKTKQQLSENELIPFSKLSSKTDTIMTAHIIIPSIDPYNCATVSKPILDILRHEIGFSGVIISDSLVMEGFLKNSSSIEEGAVKALNAGCDILLLGGKRLLKGTTQLELTPEGVRTIRAQIVQAVKEGRIPETRLNEAVDRVLRLKAHYNLYP